MDDTPEGLQRTIAATHQELNHNLAALETKAKELTDWRVQFDKRPLVMLGLAFGGGLLAAAVLGGSRSRRRGPSEYRPAVEPIPRASSPDGTWHRLRGALGAVAATTALEFLNEAAPGLKERLINPVREHLANSSGRPVQAAGFSGTPSGAAAGMAHSKGYNAADAG